MFYDHADDDDNGDCDDNDHNYDHVDDDVGLHESHALETIVENFKGL